MAGRLFSPGTPVSSTNKIDCHDIAEILLKVALINNIIPKHIDIQNVKYTSESIYIYSIILCANSLFCLLFSEQISSSKIIIGSTLTGDGRLNYLNTTYGSYLYDPVIIQAGVLIKMQCATTISGQYLEFIRSRFWDNFLSFCEMEVYGKQ